MPPVGVDPVSHDSRGGAGAGGRSTLVRAAGVSRGQRWWREVALAAAFYALYDTIRGLIGGGTAHAQHDGHDLLAIEGLLHLDPEHYLNQLLGHITLLAVPACFFYATLHFLITPGVLIWTYGARPDAYRRARTVLAVITLAALGGFWMFPTAPPRLLPAAGYQDTLAHFSNWGWWGSDASVPTAAQAIANQYAAMPSLHLAWAAWCAATIFTHTHHRGIRAAALTYPVLTALVVIATANHYLLDVLAGAALWALAHALVNHNTGRGLARTAADHRERQGSQQSSENHHANRYPRPCCAPASNGSDQLVTGVPRGRMPRSAHQRSARKHSPVKPSDTPHSCAPSPRP